MLGGMNYMYYYLHRNFLLECLSLRKNDMGIWKERKRSREKRNDSAKLGTDEDRDHQECMVPSCPVLYMYGARKPFHFHSRSWMRHLKERSDAKVVAMASGHWVWSWQEKGELNMRAMRSFGVFTASLLPHTYR